MNAYQERFASRKFGVFNHFLYGEPGGFVTEQLTREEEAAEWKRQCNAFDPERIAHGLHEIGAGYYFITLMQGQRFMLAPNAAFDRICKTKPGECCSERDVVAELITALGKYDIDLCLYYTGDGPYRDTYCSEGMDRVNLKEGEVNLNFVKNWAEVLEEYAVRYGDGIKAWWIDGCYDANVGSHLGYTEEALKYYYDAVKKGNPNALVAFNNGIKTELYKWYSKSELTPGEFCSFSHVPETAEINGALAHYLIPLGINEEHPQWGGWRQLGERVSREQLRKYIEYVNDVGGVVTVDIAIDHYGNWDKTQFDLMKGILK